jgi:hypothetical protein
MGIEVQMREGVLAQAFAEFVQARLFTLCVPLDPLPLYVDHLDTVPSSVTFADTAAGEITISLKIDVFTATELDVEGHPNDTPTGAAAAVGDVGVAIGVAMRGTVLTIVSADPDASGLPGPGPLRAAVEAAIDAALQPLVGGSLLNTAPVVSALRPIGAATPDLARGGGVVAMRFGGGGAVTPQLAPTQDWGVFLDADEATGLLTKRMPAGLPVNVRWLPNGSTPAIGAGVNFNASALGIDVASIGAIATAGLAFIAPSTLKVSAAWDLDLGGILGPFEGLARSFARDHLRDLVVNQMPGVTPEGAQGFSYTIPLPAIPPLLGARPLWQGISSSPAGMTLGGPVLRAPSGGREIMIPRIWRFGRPTWWGHCRERARVGDGSPPAHFERSQLSVIGGVNLSDAGALCSARILPPNEWLTAFLVAGVAGLSFKLTVDVAEQVKNDVRILVRTARGARFVDLGRPIVIIGEDGELDVQVNWFDDCVYLSGGMLKLATGERLAAHDLRPPPLEDPNWIATLGATQGFNTHVVTMSELNAGEIVVLRARGLQIEVTADEAGEATIPALIGLGPDMGEATIERLSRQPLTGALQVRTTEFTWLATVGEADAAAVRDMDGTARVARRFRDVDHIEEYTPDAPGNFVPVEPGGEAALNPQPLPPHPPEAAEAASIAGLAEDVTAYALPAVDGHRLALARFPDDDAVIVSTNGRRPRVAGRYTGPLVGIQADGRFAIGMNRGRVELFAVHQPEDVVLGRLAQTTSRSLP